VGSRQAAQFELTLVQSKAENSNFGTRRGALEVALPRGVAKPAAWF